MTATEKTAIVLRSGDDFTITSQWELVEINWRRIQDSEFAWVFKVIDGTTPFVFLLREIPHGTYIEIRVDVTIHVKSGVALAGRAHPFKDLTVTQSQPKRIVSRQSVRIDS